MNKLNMLVQDFVNAKVKRRDLFFVNSKLIKDKIKGYAATFLVIELRNSELELKIATDKLKAELGAQDRFCGRYTNLTRDDLFNDSQTGLLELLYHCEFENKELSEITEFIVCHNTETEKYPIYKIRTDMYGHETISILD